MIYVSDVLYFFHLVNFYDECIYLSIRYFLDLIGIVPSLQNCGSLACLAQVEPLTIAEMGELSVMHIYQ